MKKTLAVIFFMILTLPVFCLEEKLWFAGGGGIKMLPKCVTNIFQIEADWMLKNQVVLQAEIGYETHFGAQVAMTGIYYPTSNYFTGLGLKYQFGAPGEKYSFVWNYGIKLGISISEQGEYTGVYSDINAEADFWFNRFFGLGIQPGYTLKYLIQNENLSGPYIKVYFLFDWWQNMTKTVRGGWEF